MRHELSDNLVMIAELTIKPENLDEFLDYNVENLATSRSYPGNIKFDILIDEARPYTILFYEIWDSSQRPQHPQAVTGQRSLSSIP
jgi:quinol monooxygenase YgiN